MDAAPQLSEGEAAEVSRWSTTKVLRYELLRDIGSAPGRGSAPPPPRKRKKPRQSVRKLPWNSSNRSCPMCSSPHRKRQRMPPRRRSSPTTTRRWKQMLNNKPRAAQPAPKAPAAPRPAAKPAVTAPKKKSLLERIGSFPALMRNPYEAKTGAAAQRFVRRLCFFVCVLLSAACAYTFQDRRAGVCG